MQERNIQKSGFRTLSNEEVTAVSGGDGEGGDDGPGIVVKGVRPKPAVGFIQFDRYGGGFTLPGFGDMSPYPEGGAGKYDHCSNLAVENDRDNQVDFQAQQIANAIKDMPDWNAREYAAVVYEVDGVIKAGLISRGETVAEAQAQAIAAGQADFAPQTRLSLPSDLGDGQILAVIHNHPDLGYNNREDIENRYPSNNVGANGDYQTFNSQVGIDSRFINSAAFAQYILGPDGVLREFNASEGVVSSATDTDPDGRSDLTKDRRNSC